MMILGLVLVSLSLVLAEPEAAQRRYAAVAPSTPTLAYVAAPLVVGSQRATVPAAPLLQQQYVARTYNGITTLALEQQPSVAAPLIAAPAVPAAPAAPAAAPSRIVVTGAAAAPARVVVAEPEPAPLRLYAAAPNLVFAAPAPAPAPSARVVALAQAPAPAAAPAAAAVVSITAEAAPLSSSSQYFARNYNGVPTVTYFVVGPAPVTAPVAVAPQQGALPARRPGVNPVPAGEPVNQGDVEVLDA